MAAQLAKRKASPPFSQLPSETPNRAGLGPRLRDLMVPMRDGIRLATDVYLPSTPPPYHVILTRMPYGKIEPYCFMPLVGDFFNRKGYAFVVQDVRGKWGSEGVFEPNKIANEIPDGHDTIEWICGQPWSNGRVAMWGESYFGFTSYAAAASKHSNLRCIAPGNITVDRYRATFRAGALQLNTVGIWAIRVMAREYQNLQDIDLWHLPLADMANAAGIPSKYFDQLIENPRPGRFWEERSLLGLLEEIEIPVLHWSGWYDCYLGSTISDWRAIRRRAGGPANYLFVGPWDHDASADKLARVGRIEVGTGPAAHRWDTFHQFFDRHLMDLDNGFGSGGTVHYYAMGADQWRDSDSWPPRATRSIRFFLHSNGSANTCDGDGTLSDAQPTDEPCDRFAYDPSHPVADAVDLDCWAIAAQRIDRRGVESRPDVLCYSSGPFQRPVEISGPIEVQLCAASSALDTDFTVTLVDVYPDGYCDSIQSGILRASCRHAESEPSPIEPHRIYAFQIDLWSTSYLVKAGHRLRVEVSSSCFNRYDRNCNTGEAFGRAATPIVANQTIYHTSEWPSFVEMFIAE